jgi:hypothetical protein
MSFPCSRSETVSLKNGRTDAPTIRSLSLYPFGRARDFREIFH